MDTVASNPQQLPVVVCIDRAREHPAVVDLGVVEAARRAAALAIVHVWPSRYGGPSQARGPLPTEADSRHLLELAARRARHRAPRLHVTTELLRGRASTVLAERSATARLLVVGHRDAMPGNPSWGSTATYLAHQSACPLLVHRGRFPRGGPVVLTASGDMQSSSTVAYAYEEAARYETSLVALHVSFSDPATEADRYLAETLAGWSWTYPDVGVERLIVQEAEVVYTLQRAAQRGRLLVTGMGRTGRFTELVYGSLSDPVMRGAVCPVLLVPAGWPCHPSGSRPARDGRTAGAVRSAAGELSGTGFTFSVSPRS
jgi:nucleotide-binding universal stress UspA family protein